MAAQETTATELSTLYAIYDYLRNGNPPPKDPVSTKQDMQSVDPKISQPANKLDGTKNSGIFPSLTADLDKSGKIPTSKIDWVFTFQTNGPALEEYLKKHKWTNYNDLKIGVFDNRKVAELKSMSDLIPANNQTDIMNRIWEECFDPIHTKLFGGKKDTWNPADIYISNMTDAQEKALMVEICEMQERYDKVDPGAYVLLVNQVLRKHFDGRDGFLIGISLKMATWPTVPKAKAFNHACDDSFEAPKAGNEVKLTKKLHQYMSVGNKGNKGFMDFTGNSITFKCKVSMDGSDPLVYFWESKSPTATSAHSTEMKDIVQTEVLPLTPRAAKSGSPLGLARAKGGQVPVDTFKELIEEFSGDKVNFKIPTKDNEYLGKDIQDTGGDVQYWKDKIKKVLASPLVDIKDLWFQCPRQCPRGVTLQPNKRVYKTATEWVERCNELDWMSDQQCIRKYGIPKAKKFKNNFRGKLRGIRYMEAIINAHEQGKLGEFLIRAYYTAAKIKLKKDDLQGPYVKIASSSF